ncbi:hypothetical protein Tco_1043345 [Tanacetum coccineum]|uniref:Uncharacterized protein n=1 Tax=Tanacetum coccineum TaxID=301880 RepID=A0ABQ5GN05_9ASTR
MLTVVPSCTERVTVVCTAALTGSTRYEVRGGRYEVRGGSTRQYEVKALELKLNTRSRKVVMSESDSEDEEEQDVDPLIKLAKAAAASDARFLYYFAILVADVSHSLQQR